jgi:hypothetical protein
MDELIDGLVNGYEWRKIQKEGMKGDGWREAYKEGGNEK